MQSIGEWVIKKWLAILSHSQLAIFNWEPAHKNGIFLQLHTQPCGS